MSWLKNTNKKKIKRKLIRKKKKRRKQKKGEKSMATKVEEAELSILNGDSL